MIYAIGDSHAKFCFRGIPEVTILHIGTITLRRILHSEDTLLAETIAAIEPTESDFIIFCFGEIDIRCHVKSIVEHRTTITMEGLLKDWASKYALIIAALQTNGARLGILSIIPPTSKETTKKEVRYPAHGLDIERALYTKTINRHLEEVCKERGWIYFDVYSPYVDESGMLPTERGDGTIHIGDNKKVKELLREVSCVK